MPSAQTTLNGAINAGVLALTARDALGFPASNTFEIEIDSERILVGAGAGTTAWTSLTRGYDGTAAASHLDGATITLIQEAYTSLALVKADMDTDDADDAVIQSKVDAANGRLILAVQGFVGPSADSTRTYDFTATTSDRFRRRLFIPGGIRNITTLEVASGTSQAFVAAAAGDVLLLPRGHRRLPGYPASEIVLTDVPTGSITSFSNGYGVIRATGPAGETFGFEERPAELVEIATTLAKRMVMSRQSGSGDVVATTAWGSAVLSRFLSADDMKVVRYWKYELASFRSI